MTTLGLDQPLYILRFDHRESFQNLFARQGTLIPAQTAEIAAKHVTYDVFRKAIQTVLDEVLPRAPGASVRKGNG